MPSLKDQVDRGLPEAIRRFWTIRTKQALQQGKGLGRSDTGERGAVTGGAQMNGFVDLVKALLIANGVQESWLFSRASLELPGWFRPEKKWDLVIASGSKPNAELLACLELKSHIGPSFGNNFNNRTEEALGSATDLRAAYREGAFAPASKPWLGYLMLLEDAPGSSAPVSAREPHFAVFPEFRGASYARRYELLTEKLVRESLYDAGCLILSDRDTGLSGMYREPNPELNFLKFTASLLGKVIGAMKAMEPTSSNPSA